MNYCIIEEDSSHIQKLIDWLIDEVVSAGGDGDALWYSRYFDVEQLLPILEKYNKYNWTITKYDRRIILHDGQESLTVTNRQEDWDNAPIWQQVKIYY